MQESSSFEHHLRDQPCRYSPYSARHRRCKGISGKQLMRTAALDEPTPFDV
jgi:hypothetical protein